TEVRKELTKITLPEPDLKNDEVLIQVSACGVCHTDISFWHHGVPVRHSLPLTLGHEISGIVVKGNSDWLGKKVIVPAVLPCGDCWFCRNNRSNVCRNQKMPGNDFHGGFASHVVVPAKFLCPVPENMLSQNSLEQLCVIADAVSTPFQVVKKSEIENGDTAIVIGTGGIGIYAVQILKAEGARVIALDIDAEKLENAKSAGADGTLMINGLDVKTIKDKIKQLVKEYKSREVAWKIFEMSGTRAGQELAFSLITFGSVLSVVGFTPDKNEVRLSNLMAFDAKLIGTWGCRAELYPEVLELVSKGKIKISPFVEFFNMSTINEVLKNTLEHKYKKRSILIPDF
ncbi:MAG: 6-hydroxycyclohex-1-ene-1-carbonyl-CoA dehydrogenase, partial [Bacteroidetes bacterium RIFCSPLOWO2_02_FULL_36_8]